MSSNPYRGELPQTYTGISRLAKNYFALLCKNCGLKGRSLWLDRIPDAPLRNPDFEISEEQLKSARTFTITVYSVGAYNLMSCVFEAEGA